MTPDLPFWPTFREPAPAPRPHRSHRHGTPVTVVTDNGAPFDATRLQVAMRLQMSSLTPAQRSRVERWFQETLEVLTGYRTGEPHPDRPDEPALHYDPMMPLTVRRKFKAQEMAARGVRGWSVRSQVRRERTLRELGVLGVLGEHRRKRPDRKDSTR